MKWIQSFKKKTKKKTSKKKKNNEILVRPLSTQIFKFNKRKEFYKKSGMFKKKKQPKIKI